MEETSENPQHFYDNLIDASMEIGKRYQAIFELKNIASKDSITKLIDAYNYCEGSVLLKHELLYALGQFDTKTVDMNLFKDFLIGKVNDESENSLSRHEAAEALANYFLPELEQLYQKHLNSQCNELRWTCEIAIEKVKNKEMQEKYGLKYAGTKEPAAPFSDQEFSLFLQEKQLKELYEKDGYLGLLIKQEISLFHKYRIMYLMRNRQEQTGKETLCKLLGLEYFKTQTCLLKHEICFILGQIGCDKYENLVQQCIENDQEQDIVRHEALAAVASQSKDHEYLEKFVKHQNQLIRESAEVAQFTIKYWHD